MKIFAVIIAIPILALPLLCLSITKTIIDWAFFPSQQRFALFTFQKTSPPPDDELTQYQHPVHCNNQTLIGYVIPPAEITKSNGTIVYFHGNAETAHGAAKAYARLWHQNNYYSVFATYPGYGGSDGSILSEQDVIAAGQAFIDLAKTLPKGKAQGLILWGSSIGTGIAMRLAADNADDVLKTILHAPYYSLDALVQSKTVGCCVCCTRPLKYNLETHQDLIRFSRHPCKDVLLIHAENDRVIPFEQSERLFQSYLAARDDMPLTTRQNVKLYKLVSSEPLLRTTYLCIECGDLHPISPFWHRYLPPGWRTHLLTPDSPLMSE